MKIFISYSHQDKTIKDYLIKHLSAFQNEIDLWDDQKIRPGEDWHPEIKHAIQTADAAIMLISSDFLSSDFICNKERPLLLERKAKEGLKIIPVIVKPCPWKRIDWLKPIQVIQLKRSCLSRFFRKPEAINDKEYARIAEKIHETLIKKEPEKRSQTRTSFKTKHHIPINVKQTIFIEIENQSNKYLACIHQNQAEHGFQLGDIKLGPKEKPSKNLFWTLKDLVAAVVTFNEDYLERMNERVQLDIGMYLYQETIGRLPESEQDRLNKEKIIALRIITNDEWIASLPWNLIAEKGKFKCPIGWSIAISSKITNDIIELPPSPRLLFVAPLPTDAPDTRAKDHLEDLEDLLSSHDSLLSSDNHIKIVETWDDYIQAVKTFQPQMVYYYGHCKFDDNQSRLIFAQGKHRKKIEKPLYDFSLYLQQMEFPPLLVYLNCCQGDAGGFFGAGMNLGDFIPTVITNRTIAYIFAAQKQALSIWKNLLLKAFAPHEALTFLNTEMDLEELSISDIRWITPVLHCHYHQWKATAPKPPDRLTSDPHWHLKIDRVSQFSLVSFQSRLMLREKKPKSLVFVWYGLEGQGVEIFHKRVWVELREDLTNTFVYTIRPAWPLHLESYQTSFSHVLSKAFQVNTIEDIPGRIRSESQGESGKQTLVYVRHEPVRATNLINPESLKNYIDWWDKEVVSKLHKDQFALLCVSFIVKNPPLFAECIENEHIDELDLKHTVFWLLDEMEKVAKKDLLLFLKTHNIQLPIDRRDKVLSRILRKTEGRYEQTIGELKELRKEAWRVIDEQTNKTKPTKKTFDY